MQKECNKNYRMNPAWGIARMCARPGRPGYVVLAELTSVAPSTVFSWFRPKDRNGTGGLIPVNRQKLLYDRARQRGINISAEQIIGVDNSFFENQGKVNGRRQEEDTLG
jgi:hypothetical protein